ncbi:MAG TPA: DnaJ domain-containing protein [Bacteroidales bacterium]|nr:DnaJ domain-containing protein [Bacteroidales bacterium]
MEASGYLNVLGLKRDCTLQDIKKAYRRLASEYHPDHNKSEDAADKFIAVTEAYEFLITNFSRLSCEDNEFIRAMEDWQKYRGRQARQRADAFARASYSSFSKTDFYKTTRFFNKTTILISIIISLVVLFMSVFGYIYRIKHPIPGLKNPSVLILIIFILLGIVLCFISYVHLKAFLEETTSNPRYGKKNK